MNVNPGLIIQDLSQQVATQAVEMAAMRAYIEGLHKTLGRATIESQTEDANGAMVSARDT